MDKHGRVLLISYHFYPDPIVGAKRPSELAISLKDAGYPTKVIAARVPERVAADVLKRRVAVQDIVYVAAPPKVTPTLAAWLKKVMRALTGKWQSETPSPSAGVRTSSRRSASPVRAARKEGWFDRLRRNYLAMEAMFQWTKLWAVVVILRALWMRQRFDLIITSGPPVAAHLVGLALKKWFRAKWIMDMRDPWPTDATGIAIAMTHSPFREWAERHAEEWCYRASDRIVCVAPGNRKRIMDRLAWSEPKLAVILNGFDEMNASPEKKRNGRLSFLYAGTLYYNRNPFPLLEAFASLLKEPDVDRRFTDMTFVGYCQTWGGIDLEDWLKQHEIADCVRVLPPVGPKEIESFMDEASVLINFAQNQPSQIPAKAFDYLASRKEALVIAEANSDTGALFRSTGMGRVVDPDDQSGLLAVLRDLYEFYVVRKGVFTYRDDRLVEYSRAFQNAKYIEVIRNCIHEDSAVERTTETM